MPSVSKTALAYARIVLSRSPRLASSRKGVAGASSRSSSSAFQPSGPYCSQKALLGLKQQTCSSVARTTARQWPSAPATPPSTRSGSGSRPTHNLAQLDVVARASRGIAVVVGFVDRDGDLFNAAAFIHDGEVKAVYHKVFLPNYGVFDEKRYFVPGHRAPIVRLDGVPIGVSVCEDCWFPAGPMAWEAEHGAHVLININGSPYHYGKRAPREAMVGGRAADYGAFVAWVDPVGGQDELVFDGNSVVFDPHGRQVAHRSE